MLIKKIQSYKKGMQLFGNAYRWIIIDTNINSEGNVILDLAWHSANFRPETKYISTQFKGKLVELPSIRPTGQVCSKVIGWKCILISQSGKR